jgi:S1-C subfamily serine protease
MPVNGDIITAINDFPIQRIDELIAFLERETLPGDVVMVNVWRDGQPVQIAVTLQARPE